MTILIAFTCGVAVGVTGLALWIVRRERIADAIDRDNEEWQPCPKVGTVMDMD